METDQPTPVRVLHATLNLSRRGGGVAAYVRMLCEQMARHGVPSTVVGLGENGSAPTSEPWAEGVRVVQGLPIGPRSLGYSPALWRRLGALVDEVDVVHLHGIRTLLNWRLGALARAAGKPVIVSPHGQLAPWALSQHVMRKRVTDLAWVRRTLSRSAVVHAVSEVEARDIRRILPHAPIAVVPIGVDAPAYATAGNRQVIDSAYPHLRNKRLLVFCSLLTPRKGLMTLAQAWARTCINHPDWHLVIAGHEVGDHRSQVQAALDQAGATDQTTFIGEVSEPFKRTLLTAGQVLVLPTEYEAFGIIIAEALACATPVLTTRQAPWPDLLEHQCGWWIDTGLEPLSDTLSQVLAQPAEVHQTMGRAGRRLIEQHYDWPRLVEPMRQLYDWPRHMSPKPAFIDS